MARLIRVVDPRVPSPAAERVQIPFRRVSGVWAQLLIERVGDRYAVSWGTGGPGHGCRSTLLRLDPTHPNQRLAVEAGAMQIRDWWAARNVPAVVADLQEWIDRWE